LEEAAQIKDRRIDGSELAVRGLLIHGDNIVNYHDADFVNEEDSHYLSVAVPDPPPSKHRFLDL